ncbi:ABC transporter substrate-binding protein [Limnochorda pilosa]|nr:ABC transporter substrate-binding protein [Limnochorda pilosa]
MALVALTVSIVLVFAVGTVGAQEKVFHVSMFEDPTTQNPYAGLGPQATVWNAFVTYDIYYSGLYGYAPPTLAVVPGIAAGDPPALVEEQVAGTAFYTATIPLRKDLTWSDGTPLTAADVVFSYNTVVAFGAVDLGGNWASYNPIKPGTDAQYLIDHAEAVDEYTVKFYLTYEPGLAEWNFGSLMMPVFQKKHWEPVVTRARQSDNPLEELRRYENANPVSSGAFMFGQWERGAFYENVKNPYFKGDVVKHYANGAVTIDNPDSGFHYATSAPAPEGDPILTVTEGPYADAANYRLFLNQNAGALALISGDVDFFLNSLGLAKGLQQQLEGKPGVTMIENHTNGFRYLSFNIRKEPFKYPEFRQAVATLIDRQLITQNILQGVAFPLATVVPPGNAAWYNPDVTIWGQGMSQAQRVAEAVRLLKSAGFTWQTEPKVDAENDTYTAGSGLILPDGQPVKPFEMLAPTAAYDPLRATFALWIERWMRELGMPVTARLTDFNTISTKVYDEQDFDMWMLGWSLGIYPDHMYYFFHSSQAGLGGFNAQGYNDPAFDRLAEEFLSATDLETARDLAFQLQEKLAEDVPYVVLFDTPIIEAFRGDRLEFPYTEVLGGLQYWDALPSQVKLIK